MGNIHIRNKLKGITPCKTLTYEEVCSRIEIIRLNQSLAQTLINQLLTIGRIARRRNGLGMVVAYIRAAIHTYFICKMLKFVIQPPTEVLVLILGEPLGYDISILGKHLASALTLNILIVPIQASFLLIGSILFLVLRMSGKTNLAIGLHTLRESGW